MSVTASMIVPDLAGFDASIAEVEAAKKWTRIYRELATDYSAYAAWSSWIVVDGQQFCVAQERTRSDANWYCWQLAKMINAIRCE